MVKFCPASSLSTISFVWRSKQFIVWLCAICCVYLNAPVARTSAADEFQLLEIANGNFVHIGHFPPLNSQNQGDIANIGFIVGEKCIAVIDTGSSIAVGQKLKAAIGRVSKLPICAVVITHVHPDHLLGLNAFGSDPGIVFYGHHRLPRQIKARYRYYLESVRQELNLGEPEKYLIDNEIFKTIKNTVRIDLGNRILEIKAWGHAHTCLLYTSPSPRDAHESRMPSSA